MDQLEKFEFRKARDFGSIINDTFAFIRQNIGVLFKALIFITGPLLIIQGVLAGLYSSKSSLMLAGGDTSNPFGAIFSIEYLLLILCSLVSYTFVTLIALEFMVLYTAKGPGVITVDDIWKAVKKDFWMIVFTNIGTFFVVMFFMLLLIIPGIYFGIVMALVAMIRVQERIGFFAAIRRGRKLISGSWWFTVGLLFLMAIIVGMMGSVLALPSAGVSFFALLHKADVSNYFFKTLFIITGILQQLTSMFSVVILTSIGFQYFSLVEKKEGHGLLQKVEEIGKPKET